jgi:ABC-type enterochelin transport system ATPase subunit
MISIKNVSKSYGTKLVLITLVFILKKERFTALLVKMVLGKQHYSNVLLKNTMAISFAAMENQRISGLSSNRALFFLK